MWASPIRNLDSGDNGLGLGASWRSLCPLSGISDLILYLAYCEKRKESASRGERVCCRWLTGPRVPRRSMQGVCLRAALW
jgi:hypothetical protein